MLFRSILAVLFVGKMLPKLGGVYPLARRYTPPHTTFTTLLMSTGLTFGTISSLFGLSHGIVDQAQYSALVAAVIGSAVIPTLIANAWFMPRHLLKLEEAGPGDVAVAGEPLKPR